jgi:PadR family transcriptional regulator, regulatory protein PadR
MALPSAAPDQEWKKGSAELLVLSLLEDQARHGYDLSKLIELRSGGALRFHVTSLYPLLYRLEKRRWIDAVWVEKAEQRRRRYYSLTPLGRKVLRSQRKSWQEFIAAVGRVMGVENA